MNRKTLSKVSALLLCTMFVLVSASPVAAEITVEVMPRQGDATEPLPEPVDEDWCDDTTSGYTSPRLYWWDGIGPLSDEISLLGRGDTDEWYPAIYRPVEGYLLVKISHCGVEVFWKGELPQEVEDVIAQYPHVRVKVHDVPFDEEEFLTAQWKVIDRLIADPPPNAQWEFTEHGGDRSALTFWLHGTMTAEEIANLEAEIESMIDIPFFVKVSEEQQVWPLVERNDP